MGNVALEGFGGGSRLNFKVVAGLTQPGSATENTIWVKTEKMTGWFFDVTQPENLAEGMVWFHEGASNVFAINALKKNGIQLYPMGAKQMLNGSLVEKPAMIYQSGKWNDLYVPAVVYDYGYENLDVLGGNGFRLRKGGSGYVEKYDNYFTVMSTGLSSVAMATHDDAINVSNATVLNAIVENREPNTGRFSYYGIGVIYPDAEDLGTDAFISSSKVSKEGEQTLTIDLRDVSGEVKIAVTALDYYMPVYKIWFE